MNPFCSEAAIRKAADWRAFKQGTELIASVADAVATEKGWRGTVRDGRKPLRVSVVARSATDIEARCPCRENQSTGAFCAHAVAVGLVLATGKPTGSPQPAPVEASVAAKPAAWLIEFPPTWRRMLAGARLTVKISLTTELPVPADDALTAWLNEAGARNGGMVLLDENRLVGFLRAIVDHPRISSAGEPIETASDGLIRIASVLPEGNRVIVTPETAEIHAIGALTLEIAQHRLSLVTKSLPPSFAAISHGNAAKIPMDQFLESVESLGEVFAWPEEGWLAGLHFISAKPEITITIGARGTTLEAYPLVQYGDAPPVVPGCGRIPGLPKIVQSDCFIRDVSAESAAMNDLEREGFLRSETDPSCWKLVDESRISDFLNEGIQAFQSRYTIHEGPGLSKRMRELARISPKFEMQSSGADWLEFNLSFQSGSSGAALDSSEVWRMLKSGNTGKAKRFARELEEIIEPLFSELDLTQENGRFIARGASIDCIREIQKNLSKQNNKNELNTNLLDLPATINAELRPYQHAGLTWVIDRLKRFHGALLADDMGLGKTIQTIASIEHLFLNHPSDDPHGANPVLVVATTSLLGNWRAEFAKFAPGRRVRILHGSGREIEKERVGAEEVLLTSFGTLTRDLAWYLRREFLAVVVDEASLMRNPDTDHAKALFKLKAHNRLALTGTPVENGVRDLWSIFRFIQPGWLGGRREFQERYESEASGADPAALRRLRIKTAPFLLRRTKEEVAADLPAKIRIDEFVDLTKTQQSVYRELLVEGRRGVERLADAKQAGAARMQMLTTLLRLRQACCDLALLGNDRLKQLKIQERSAKVERLLELIDSAISGGHKVLVFSQFKTQLSVIHELLCSRDVEALQLDGSTRNRQELVDRFQTADGPPVFLISLKAGGYGLNLTAADVVIHFDPWWNPAAESQASDRAHRIGQTRPVTVYRLLTRGTVEEKVVALQTRKRAIAAAIDETGGGDVGGWTEQDLAGLLE